VGGEREVERIGINCDGFKTPRSANPAVLCYQSWISNIFNSILCCDVGHETLDMGLVWLMSLQFLPTSSMG